MYGGFLKWGYPQIRKFGRIFHNKSFPGTFILGHLDNMCIYIHICLSMYLSYHIISYHIIWYFSILYIYIHTYVCLCVCVCVVLPIFGLQEPQAVPPRSPAALRGATQPLYQVGKWGENKGATMVIRWMVAKSCTSWWELIGSPWMMRSRSTGRILKIRHRHFCRYLRSLSGFTGGISAGKTMWSSPEPCSPWRCQKNGDRRSCAWLAAMGWTSISTWSWFWAWRLRLMLWVQPWSWPRLHSSVRGRRSYWCLERICSLINCTYLLQMVLGMTGVIVRNGCKMLARNACRTILAFTLAWDSVSCVVCCRTVVNQGRRFLNL